MKAKIVSTTDGKYINEVIDVGDGYNGGDVVEYKDLYLPVDEVVHTDDLLKVSCSNYVLVLRVIKD